MKHSPGMTKSTSVFLDVLRVVAALIVFAQHILDVFYPPAIWLPAHPAVIVFFVLSGYVIAFSTLNRKGMDAKKYVIARFSRLYSVLIPALLLTGFLLLCGRAINPDFYHALIREHEFARCIVTAVFLQSVWWLNLVPHDNGPFWSLGYEFWYYALFGAMVFARDWKWKWGLALLGCLIVGENVLLLLPIWVMGVAAFIYKDRLALSPRFAAIGFVVMLIVTLLSIFLLPEYPRKVGVPPLLYAGSYGTDWLLGLELSSVIWLYSRAWESIAIPAALARGVQWSANHTFSLYLYHAPVIFFASAIGIIDPFIWWQAVLGIGAILGFIIALSEVTESKRGWWKNAFEFLWERWQPRGTESGPEPERLASKSGAS